ncbi:MAG: hypothetical protein GXO15_00610 [Crenarchaeota archaeon]|nr:hypothetical protein [Thermoproteota archaeon]
MAGDAWQLLALFRGLLERAERLSEEYWVPRIDWEDGLALATAVFLVARQRGGGLFVDAGAGVGYSTLWMLYGLAPACEGEGGCRLVAVENDPGRAAALRRMLGEASSRLRASGFTGVEVEAVEGDALEYLESLGRGEPLGVIVDIEKQGYLPALRLLEDRLPSGGLAAFHNALGPMPLPPGFREAVEEGPWRRLVLPTGQGLLLLVHD